ncbi:MAG: cytochrome b/b6 domain-containing protein [Saccharospirillaceae bacterium]|nr:cytochrome b/b6 domain-containing protein [Colwellia sp.]NRB77133.1 cytochrome b/b6 domain-containing protein [Saccharospirillaceae bacterium]
MNTVKYDITAKILHWLSALVILWATIGGLYIILLDTEEHIKLQISELNISITTLFIPIFCFRILYRVTRKSPLEQGIMPTIEEKMARLMHNFLYALVSFVLISGILMMDRPVPIFDLFQFTQLLDNSDIITTFKILHKYSTQLLAVCILLHIMAVIKHEIMGKKILKRMT